MKTGVQVVDAMSVNVISVSADFTIAECAKVMTANKIGAVIVQGDSVTKGIITERDIVRKVVSQGLDVKKAHVGDHMEKEVITIPPESDLYEALLTMRDNDVRHLPVVSKKKIFGFLTMNDILKIEPQLFDVIAEKYDVRDHEESNRLNSASDEVEGIIKS